MTEKENNVFLKKKKNSGAPYMVFIDFLSSKNDFQPLRLKPVTTYMTFSEAR